MKKVPVEEAVGMILGHDITKIVPREFKGRAFKKGHIIQKEDIDALLKLGKEHIYVWGQSSGEIHEDEAALRIARAVTGKNVEYGEPVEGKTTLRSTLKGLFKVDSKLMRAVNAVDNISVASLPGNFAVEEGGKIAGARIIPLMIAGEKVEKIESLCAEKGAVFTVLPYKKLKAAVIVTGSEVYKGRIADKFTPVMQNKLAYFNAACLGHAFCPDDIEEIKKTILAYKKQGADIILLTGGMSVDPDDVTPSAIRNAGAHVVTYGVPVQPGNMFMLAYLDTTVLMGVPGCAMYFKTTVLDVALPRVFTGETLTKDDFVNMGEGGFCLNCEVCRYPQCFFCR